METHLDLTSLNNLNYYINLFSTPYYQSNCYYIFFSLTIAILLSIILLLLSFLLNPQNSYNEKNSSYECGFNPYSDARLKLDIHFYLVAILFVVFDLEIIFLFPWSVGFFLFLKLNNFLFGYWIGIIFFFMLTLGFYYEWKKGALDWW